MTMLPPPIKALPLGFSRADWHSFLAERGLSQTHARALMGHVATASDEQELHPSLPKQIRREWSGVFRSSLLEIETARISGYDESVKFVFKLSDGMRIESVLMPETTRLTLCLSSQVGCAQGCVFCHTGRMGLKRHLTAAEIVGQYRTASHWMKHNPQWSPLMRGLSPHISNIVFMGMGEPLDNPDAVGRAWEVFTDPWAYRVGPKHISVSTAGHLGGLKVLSQRFPLMRFALSLHSPFASERSRIMPINRQWPLEEVLEWMKSASSLQKNGLLVQYTLIKNVNDSEAHARATIALLEGLNVKVNIIPLNAIGPARLQSPDEERLWQFRQFFYEAGIRSMIRFSKGQDIDAACGQLVQNS